MTLTSSLTTPMHGRDPRYRASGRAAPHAPPARHLIQDQSLRALARQQWPLAVLALAVEAVACAELLRSTDATALVLLAGPAVLLAQHAPALTTLALLAQLVPQAMDIDVSAVHLSAIIVTGIMVAHRHHLLTALLGVYWFVAFLVIPTATSSLEMTEYPNVKATILMFTVIAMTLGLMTRQWMDARFAARLEHDAARRLESVVIGQIVHDSLAHDNTRMVLQAEDVMRWRAGDSVVWEELSGVVAEGQDVVIDLAALLYLTEQSSQAPRALDPDLRGALHRAHDTLSRVGLRAEIVVDGEISQVPPLIASAMTRAIDESVVNMTKYATPAAPCTIMVEVAKDQAGVMTANDFPDTDTVTSRTMSSGFGLVGLQEHVEALGGDLVQTTFENRWTLALTLPLTPGALS